MRSASNSVTCTPVFSASQVMPLNMAIEIPPRSSSVVAAFLDFGSLKAGTPLATASMPVNAVVPDENALATRKTRAIPVNDCSATTVQLALSAWRS
jgi:hypothetical protein